MDNNTRPHMNAQTNAEMAAVPRARRAPAPGAQGRRTGIAVLTGLALMAMGQVSPVIAQISQTPQTPSLPAAGSAVSPVAPSTGLTPPMAPAGSTEQPKRLWFIQPRVSVTETFTDNVNPVSGIKLADQITEVSPGIRLEGDTARLKAYADYQVTGYAYARGSYGNRSQNALNSFGTLEALEKRLYLDFSGVISQQSLSAFAPQVASNATPNANRAETSTYRLSPYLRGRLGSEADYEVRYSSTWTDTKSSLASSLVLQDWSAKVKNSIAKSRFGWTIDASTQRSAYSNGSKSESDRLRALASYQITPEIKLSVSAGQESNDYIALKRQSKMTSGYGLDWTPTERTLVSAFSERRMFGDGYNYAISHRTPLMAFKFTDSRDVSFQSNQATAVGRGTVYDLLFTQLASAFPDPVARAQQVTQLLAQTGISPSTQVTSSFLTSRVTVLKRQDFSTVLNGVRNTVTVSFNRSVQDIVGTAAGTGDFAQSTSIAQRGITGNWAYRLTPLASLTATGLLQESSGSGASTLSSRQKSLNLTYTTRVAAQVNFSLGVRTSAYASNTISYRENAMFGTLVAKF